MGFVVKATPQVSGTADVDEAEVRRAVAALFAPDGAHEVSLLVHGNGSAFRTGSRTVRGADAVIAHLRAADGANVLGTYWTINTVRPDLEGQAKKSDITARRWLFLDFDPRRLKGTNSTDEEHAAAEEAAHRCREYLLELNWPEPVMVDSGNGWALFYRIDLPATAHSHAVLKRITHKLAKLYSNDAVDVDEAVHNDSRLARLPGTMNRKGPHSAERPHRRCRIVILPRVAEVVPLDLLMLLAGPDTPPKAAPPPPPTGKRIRANATGKGYWQKAFEGEIAAVRGSADGNRNTALNTAAFKLFTIVAAGHLSQGEVESALLDAALSVGLPEAEVRRTIESARAGLASPRPEPEQQPQRNGTAPKGVPAAAMPRRARKALPYKPFPFDALPATPRELVLDAAESIGCDEAMVALPALATLAGAIGNSRAVTIKKGWSEPCCLWCVTIARSGSMKSPAFGAATDPLVDVQFVEIERHRQEKEARQEDDPPVRPATRYVVSDATVEAIGEVLRDNPRGLLLARDELDGWFQSFVRYKGKAGGSDRAQWLELHRGGSLLVERLTREKGSLAVRRALVSITGTIQPAVLAKALDRDARLAGLAARLLVAMPRIKKRVWVDSELDDRVIARYRGLIETLTALQMDAAGKGPKPHYLGFATDAKVALKAFVNELGEQQYQSDDERAAILAKMEGAAARLAGIHHVVSHATGRTSDHCSITLESTRAGIELARWFTHEWDRVSQRLDEGDDDARTRQLIDLIETFDGWRITPRELMRKHRHAYPDATSARLALEGLVQSGLASWVDAPAQKNGQPGKAAQLRPDRRGDAGRTDDDDEDEEGAE